MLSQKALLRRFYLFLIITQYKVEMLSMCSKQMNLPASYLSPSSKEHQHMQVWSLKWAFLTDTTLDLYLQSTSFENSPQPPRSSAWPWKLFPKQSIPVHMWVSSTAHQLLPALHHPMVSFQCPLRLLSFFTASEGEADAWQDLTLRKGKLAGWLVQGLWYKPDKEGEPPWCYRVGAALSVSPAVPGSVHTTGLFSCGNASPEPVYSDDGNCCDCIQQEKLAEPECFWLTIKSREV